MKICRALISVSDTTNLIEFAKELANHNIEILVTEKRKKFPINRYDSYVSWSDG